MERVKHFSKGDHNEKFFNSFDLDKTTFRDWVVVGIFYTAIHYYEAYFAKSNRHTRSHETQDNWISNDKKISSTYDDYRELKQHRWKASYQAYNFKAEEIRDSILPKLQNIKSIVLTA